VSRFCASVASWLQAGVGHYGVFSGRKWEAQTYPLVRSFIQANA
jgi:poly(3-hydroxybutyrate) depolymerase